MPRKKVGMADAGDRHHRQRPVERRVVPHRREHPGRDADQHLDAERVERQQHGRLHAVEQRLGDRLAEEDRLAEIEPQHAAEPAHELDRQRVVQPELIAQPRDVLGRGAVAQDHRRRIARRQMDQREDDDADDDQHRHQHHQPAQDVGGHGTSRIAVRSSSRERDRVHGASPCSAIVERAPSRIHHELHDFTTHRLTTSFSQRFQNFTPRSNCGSQPPTLVGAEGDVAGVADLDRRDLGVVRCPGSSRRSACACSKSDSASSSRGQREAALGAPPAGILVHLADVGDLARIGHEAVAGPEHVPLFRLGPPLQHRRPVDHLEIDGDADRLQLLLGDDRLAVHVGVFLGRHEAQRLAVVPGLLQLLLRPGPDR